LLPQLIDLSTRLIAVALRLLQSDTYLLKVPLSAVEPRLQIRDALSDQAQMAQDLLLVETLPHDPEGRCRSDGICRREIWLGLGLVHGPSFHAVKEVARPLG
jgi:hypothetical protein